MTKPNDPDFLTQYLTAMHDQPAVHTPECLSPEAIVGLVEQRNDYPDFLPLLSHVMSCQFCYGEYKLAGEMMAIEQNYRISAQPIEVDVNDLHYNVIESASTKGSDSTEDAAAPPVYNGAAAELTVPAVLKIRENHSDDQAAMFASNTLPQAAEGPQPVRRFTLQRRVFTSALGTAVVLVLAGFLVYHFESVRRPIDPALTASLGLTGPPRTLLTQASQELTADPFGAARGAGASPAIQLLSPVNAYVLDPLPTLKWKLVQPNTTVERIEVFTGGDRWTSVDTPSGLSWHIDRPLEPDRRYTWRVTVMNDGKDSSASALLYVPPANVQTAMQRDLTPLTPLQQGILYLKAGQKDRAHKAFQAALGSESDPITRQAIQRLLDQLAQQ